MWRKAFRIRNAGVPVRLQGECQKLQRSADKKSAPRNQCARCRAAFRLAMPRLKARHSLGQGWIACGHMAEAEVCPRWQAATSSGICYELMKTTLPQKRGEALLQSVDSLRKGGQMSCNLREGP